MNAAAASSSSSTCLVLVSLILLAYISQAFVTPRVPTATSRSTFLNVAEKVEVCGFKDCKRSGGGPRLEKAFKEVLQEQQLEDAVAVESCDCQGECGYGPNVVVDGKLINGVRGKEAILQALGIEQKVDSSATA